MDHTQSFAMFLLELRALHAAKKTGTLFLATEGKNLVQCVLSQGEIVYLAFKGRRGLEAIPLIQQLTTGEGHFKEGTMLPLRVPLPPTEEVLAALEGAEITPPTPTQFAPAPAPSSLPPPSPGLSAEQQALLAKLLAEHIGPIAALVCAEYCTGAVQNVEDVVRTLAREIPDPEAARQFQQAALRRL